MKMNLFGRMLKSGERASSYLEDKNIMMSDCISLILCLALTVLNITKIIYEELNPYGIKVDIYLLGLIIFLLPVLLNRMKLTVLGRLVLCLGSMGYIWGYFIYKMKSLELIELSVYDGLRVYLLAICVVPFLVFDYKRDRMALFSVFFISLLSIMFFEEILNFFGVGYFQRGVLGESFLSMKIRILTAFFVISGGSYLFQRTIHSTFDMHQKIIRELQKKSDLAQQRNEELKIKEGKLYEANQHLEELVKLRSKKIKQQNAKMISYASLTTGKARRPIARLKTLIDESKYHKSIDYPCLFENIRKESLQVEKYIKEVSKDLNEIDHEGV